MFDFISMIFDLFVVSSFSLKHARTTFKNPDVQSQILECQIFLSTATDFKTECILKLSKCIF